MAKEASQLMRESPTFLSLNARTPQRPPKAPRRRLGRALPKGQLSREPSDGWTKGLARCGEVANAERALSTA